MKNKIFSASVLFIFALFLLSPMANAAGPRFGIVGGAGGAATTKLKDLKLSGIVQYHAGITLEIPLALGFAIQPSVLYQFKGATLEDIKSEGLGKTIDSFRMSAGYLQVPVQIQWGPDLIAFRPYVFAEPFVGFGLHAYGKAIIDDGINKTKEIAKNFKDSALKRLEYGLGLGFGVEFWKLQLSAKYYWDFGNLYQEGKNLKGTAEIMQQTMKDAIKNRKNFSGITISLALFF